jgi:hypothetical protein
MHGTIPVRPASQDLPPSAPALAAWFASARPGDRIVYWRGHLAEDLWQPGSYLSDRERHALADVAGYAWRLYERGLAHLAQRRRGEDEFDYLLEVRPRPHGAVPALPVPTTLKAA